MKYVVLLIVLVVAYTVWRNNRIAERARREAAAPPRPTAVAGPQDMVCCPVCSVHVPRPDAIAGGDGRLYCSREHRLRAGG